jgi:ferredoxin-NADP reductase
LGVQIIYVVDQADSTVAPNTIVGKINQQLLRQYVQDLSSCNFYISGPSAMVESFRKSLKDIRIPGRKIHTDYFPGFA